jgi:3-hydroxyacyl-CoA dehydrogenase
MSLNQPVHRIAIVGTGVIGASWAAYYLARGFDVIATDPGPQAEANLRKYVDDAWPLLTQVGLSPGASRDRLTFNPDMSRALAEADWVQENAPERPDFKIKLFAQMDDATPPNSIIASSSSGITMDVIQSGCKRPERCVIGHPFNPPHVVPLVEVVGGAKTSEATIERAMAFYAGVGKKAVRLYKALPGHVDNPDFASMAESMGLYGVRVEDPGQLKSAISTAFAHKGPAVIDVLTDRQELVMPPEIKLEHAKGFSLWMLKAVLNGQANEIVSVAKTALVR